MKKKLLTATAIGVGGAYTLRAVVRKRRAFEVRDKVVFITGGSRGLGLVLARQLADEGARIAICARDSDELERARAELQGRGADVLAVPCDVTEQAQIEQAVHDVIEHFGTLDVLINNAGVIQIAPLEVMTLREYEEAMKVHFWAPLYSTLAALPEMRRKRSGRIVNISSIGGKLVPPHMVPYSASKFALTGLSAGLRAELGKDGILVTTVYPPLMRTGGFYHAILKGRHRAEFAVGNIVNANPLASISTEKAATRIIQAFKHGDAETTVSRRSQTAIFLASVFPGFTADLMGLANRLLPAAEGEGSIGTARATGEESTSPLSESPLTVLNQMAAEENNEIHIGQFADA